MNIGPYALANNLFVAPMAGVTDRPFRQLSKKLGAGYAVSEMVTSRRELWNSLKTSRRADHTGEPGPVAVQIAGTDAQMMAEAAAYNVQRGAQIIDINMGCPAKKVCNKWAGSALMQDEPLALAIAQAVVQACEPHGVPVTLKMRTGCRSQRNAVALAPPSKAPACRCYGAWPHPRSGLWRRAEYDTIGAVKRGAHHVGPTAIVSPGRRRAGRHRRRRRHGGPLGAVRACLRDRPFPWPPANTWAPPLVAEVQRALRASANHYALYGESRGAQRPQAHACT